MINTVLEETKKYWAELFARNYKLYQDTKAELALGAAADASKIALAVAQNSVTQVENFWQTWGAILNPAAATVVFRVAVATGPQSDTVNVFPILGLGELVPNAAGTALVAIKGAGNGTIKAAEASFDRITVTVDGFSGLAIGDLYVGLVYRKLSTGKTRPLANVLVQVVV